MAGKVTPTTRKKGGALWGTRTTGSVQEQLNEMKTQLDQLKSMLNVEVEVIYEELARLSNQLELVSPVCGKLITLTSWEQTRPFTPEELTYEGLLDSASTILSSLSRIRVETIPSIFRLLVAAVKRAVFVNNVNNKEQSSEVHGAFARILCADVKTTTQLKNFVGQLTEILGKYRSSVIHQQLPAQNQNQNVKPVVAVGGRRSGCRFKKT